MATTTYVLAEVTIGDLNQFLVVITNEGRATRAEHSCLGTQVFTPAGESSRVLVLLEWPDLDSFERFRNDPSAPPVMRKGGAQGPPKFTVLERVAALEG
jgi:quinol monooxygenase YgiN